MTKTLDCSVVSITTQPGLHMGHTGPFVDKNTRTGGLLVTCAAEGGEGIEDIHMRFVMAIPKERARHYHVGMKFRVTITGNDL